MKTADPRAIAYYLRNLDEELRLEFVADLWSARGFDTTREEDIIVASRGSQTVRIWVDSGTQLRGGHTAIPEVDVLVTFGTQFADGSVTDRSIRIIDMSMLVEMLQYAIDRADAVDLCERHLGAPPSLLQVPRRIQTAQRLRSAQTALVPATLATLIVIAAAALIIPSVFTGGDASRIDSLGGVTTDTAVTAEASAEAESTVTPTNHKDGDVSVNTSSVSGLGPNGITNVSALATAHERVLAGQSYTLWLDTRKPRDRDPNADYVQHDVDILVDNERYLIEEELEESGDRTRIRTVYYDGNDWYLARWDGSATRYRIIEGGTNASPVSPSPTNLRGSLVSDYLSTPETTIAERVESGTVVRFRVIGRGRPTALNSLPIHNYTIEALINRNGLVRAAKAEYTVTSGSVQYQVRFRWSYGKLGTTVVETRPWFERRFEPNTTAQNLTTSAGT